MPITQPGEFLRAFVDAVVQAANEEGIAYGVERDNVLSELVSIFVQELQATTDEEVALELGVHRKTPTTAQKIILDSDSTRGA